MSKKDLKKLHKEAKKTRKGHTLSSVAIYKMSQERRRSLY